MTIIENDGVTLLVRLDRAEIESLRRQIDGRKLDEQQKELLRDIYSDLNRIEIGKETAAK